MPDVGVRVERAVGRRQPVDPQPGQAFEQQRPVAGVPRDVPVSSAYDASSNALIAACWAIAGGQIVKLPVRTSAGRRSRSGTSIQPIRQPVMEKYLENEEKTTASREVSQADRDRGGSPSSGAYSMPW